MGTHLPSEKLILLDLSIPRVPTILGCESHRQLHNLEPAGLLIAICPMKNVDILLNHHIMMIITSYYPAHKNEVFGIIYCLELKHVHISCTENHTFKAGHQKKETGEISPKDKTLAPLPESPPGRFASLLLLHVRGALVAALGAGASLLQRTVEAVAVGAVGALVTLRPERSVWRNVHMYQRLMYIQPGDIGETSPGSGCPLKGLMVASKAQPLHKQVIKTWVNKDSFEPGGGWQACHLPASQ